MQRPKTGGKLTAAEKKTAVHGLAEYSSKDFARHEHMPVPLL